MFLPVDMAVHVGGLVSVVAFYAVILITGILASRKSKNEEKKCTGHKSEVTIVGGRNINVLIGVFTMTGETFFFFFSPPQICHWLMLEIHHWFLFHICFLLATWVGGGYIMGTAEAVYSPAQGLVWAFGPLAYTLNFLLGEYLKWESIVLNTVNDWQSWLLLVY